MSVGEDPEFGTGRGSERKSVIALKNASMYGIDALACDCTPALC